MNDGFDIYTIIFAGLALFVFWKLRSVLGTRTGNERRPQDPFVGRPQPDPVNDTVIPLPQRTSEPAPKAASEDDAPAVDRWAGVAEPNSAVARGLDRIAEAERDFDAKEFLVGARAAYEMIVSAFAAGDRKTLKPLLAREVFESFSAAIAERENRGETVESNFVSIEKAEIAAAEVAGRTAQVTVRFVSKLITATRDRAGAVIDGSPTEIADLIDVWTFSRELNARDPNWRLISTEPL
ncbi:Tim44 domain-containing protein [Chelatococcus sambhunathii]|uniref:Tim44 domain-containing protein n=1 Tax=Chelatococcus sambhunathii TaxID=363953 RepID=A0ABU1DL97_9HYPH|nr:Tim44/TimA family putative adaptor protein [Chelatococcus sambhunathii]MDR4308883.1 Tim44 domain-containing protein [Chelatococcus sambhunathii]